MISFELDPAFADFNFSATWDPTLRCGPSAGCLYKLIYRARRGERTPAADFVDAIFWTLRPETWDCFQRVHGSRPISHREWFYAKLGQFLEILVYEQLTIQDVDGQPLKLELDAILDDESIVIGGAGPFIQLDEVERSLAAESYAGYSWFGLVQRVIKNPSDRVGAVLAWLGEQRLAKADNQIEQPRNGWGKNEERDRVILNCLERGLQPRMVCVELDKRTIPTLPSLDAEGIYRWEDGWNDPKTRNAIQQLFSKVRKRRISCQASDVSK